MTFLSRLRALFRKKEPEPENTEAPTLAVETAAMRAGHAVAEARYDDAVTALRSARDSADEAVVLDAILLSLPEASPRLDHCAPLPPGEGTGGREDLPSPQPSPEGRGSRSHRLRGDPSGWDELVLLIADVLVARGDRARACDQLRRAHSTAAKVLRADLLCDGTDGPATAEELDLALKLLSDVLRDDIDVPGARDRWERLRVRLGRGGEVAPAAFGATLLVDGPALPFTLVREVARGGSGVVYEARSAIFAIERTVALKLAHQRSTARTFLAHEARIAARFRGAGVVPILDVDPEEGWLAMAWAARGSLRGRLRAGGSVDQRRWLRRLVETLADIHRDGWVHGDLKPANVLFDDDGDVWLGDFALARTIGEPATPGSAGYVSPERMAGAPCEPRDDVFALGKIVVELPDTDEALRHLATDCLASATDRPASAAEVLLHMR